MQKIIHFDEKKKKRTILNFFTKPASKRELKGLIIATSILVFLSAIIYGLGRFSPASFTEKYFSLGIYPVWVNTMSILTRYLPFSVGEFIIITLIIIIPFYFVILIIDMIRAKKSFLKVLGSFMMRVATICSVFLFLLVMGASTNYFRYEFSHYANLDVHPSPVSELYMLCEKLVNEANELREELKTDKNGASTFSPMTPWELSKEINQSYKNLIEQNPEYEKLFWLSEKIPVKPVYFSEGMSYLQLSGTITPFTLEANVNVHTTDFDIPASMAHELAHISGFMREDEANFIGYLVCKASDNKFVNYSGVMSAFIYSSNALYSRDRELHQQIMSICSDKVRTDLILDSEYYNAHKSQVGEVYNTANDTYLKINDQKDGVDSYGRMVDLLLAELRSQ